MKIPNRFFPRAFTLIELLIVVAIIAILAAIAVPNFLEAQVRAKVSRAKADIRSLATAVESYMVDNNKYPDVDPTTFVPRALNPPIKLATPHSRACLTLLTTPIAYITTSKLKDPFTQGNEAETLAFYGYAPLLSITQVDLATVGASIADDEFARLQLHSWLLQSAGPDGVNFAFQPPPQGFPNAIHDLTQETGYTGSFFYDPTNGTISTGDVVRTGKGQL